MSADVIDISSRFHAQCAAEILPFLGCAESQRGAGRGASAEDRARAAVEGVKARARDVRSSDFVAEIIACSDSLDSVRPVLERIARALGKPALIRTAQDIEALSERLVQHAADIQDCEQ